MGVSNMQAIKTMYKGFRFRSRLEAKWACYFDLLGWKWDYEPIDFNGWIPDFVLHGKNQIVYVEVKPVTVFPQDTADKIDGSGCEEEVLIVGLSPFLNAGSSLIENLGWLREDFLGVEDFDGEDPFWWGPAEYHHCGMMWGFCHNYGSYHNRISGVYNSTRGINNAQERQHQLEEYWAEAQNRTQWKGGQ